MARGHAGGIAAASDLLSEHGGAIEADLQRYYGLHVGDFPWPLTARRLLELIRHLPEDSAFRLDGLDPEERMWTFDRDLDAAQIDALRYLAYVVRAAAGDKRAQLPKPIPRPSVTPLKPAGHRATAEQVRERMAELGIEVPDELLGR